MTIDDIDIYVEYKEGREHDAGDEPSGPAAPKPQSDTAFMWTIILGYGVLTGLAALAWRWWAEGAGWAMT